MSDFICICKPDEELDADVIDEMNNFIRTCERGKGLDTAVIDGMNNYICIYRLLTA